MGSQRRPTAVAAPRGIERHGALRLMMIALLGLPACTNSIAAPASASRVSIGLRPYGLAISPAGVVYVSQLDGSSVTRVQFGESMSAGLVGVGSTPTDVTFDPSGATAFVTNQFDRSVGIIDVAGARQVQTVAAASTTFRVLVSPDGQRAYATESGGRLLVINTSTRALVTTVPLPGPANGLALGLGDSLLYVTTMSGGLSVINVKTNTVVKTSTLGGTLQDVVVSPDGGTLYVAHEETGTIDVVNAASGAVSARFTVDAGVFGLKLAADGRSLWATLPAAGQVIVLDRSTGSITRTLLVGGIPRRIAFDRRTGRAAVSNEAGWVDFLP